MSTILTGMYVSADAYIILKQTTMKLTAREAGERTSKALQIDRLLDEIFKVIETSANIGSTWVCIYPRQLFNSTVTYPQISRIFEPATLERIKELLELLGYSVEAPRGDYIKISWQEASAERRKASNRKTINEY